VADAAAVSRPAARPLLLTLNALGVVDSHGSVHRLRPRVLALGQAYSPSGRLLDLASRTSGRWPRR